MTISPTTTTGIILIFTLTSGESYRLRFQGMRPVGMGREIDFGFLGWGACMVHDGTYHNPNDNQWAVNCFLEGSQRRGFYQIDDVMIPLADVVSLKRETFQYEAPLDPHIYQGD